MGLHRQLRNQYDLVCPFVLGLASLCSFAQAAVSAAQHTLSHSILHFLFSSVVCGILRRPLRQHHCAISTTAKASLQEHNCAISTIPEASLWEHNGSISTPVRLALRNVGVIDCEKYTSCIIRFFTTRIPLFNNYKCIYGTTYKYIHTYRHHLCSC